MADDDDDFGEFGGFEAAEPTVPAVAQPVSTAVASPWAVFAPVPPEPSKEGTEWFKGSVTATGGASTNVDEQKMKDAVKDEGDRKNSPPVTGTSLTETESISVGDSRVKNEEQMPAENTAESEDRWLEDLDTLSKLISTDSSTGPKDIPDEGETTQAQPCTEVPDTFYQEQLQTAREEKSLLEQELQLLREREEDLETGLSQCREDLETQRRKYEELQKKHSVDLEEMRKAGMDALAIIVEEYKELSRTAVLQQQETCEKQLTTKLQSQTDQCKQLLEEQHTRLLALLEEDREKQEKTLTEALGKQQETQQTKFEAVLEKERQSLKEHVSSTLQDQKEFIDSIVASSVEQLKTESKTLVDEHKEDLNKTIEEKTEKMKQIVMTDLEEKQKDSQATLRKTVEADREKSKQLVREAMEKTKLEMMTFIQEEKQADKVVRQKQLTSLQLFLESAKSQVSHLLSDADQDRDL